MFWFLVLGSVVVSLGALVRWQLDRMAAQKAAAYLELTGAVDDVEIRMTTVSLPASHRPRDERLASESIPAAAFDFGGRIPWDLRVALVPPGHDAHAHHHDPREVYDLAVWTEDLAGAEQLVGHPDAVETLRRAMSGDATVVIGASRVLASYRDHPELGGRDAMAIAALQSEVASVVRALRLVWP